MSSTTTKPKKVKSARNSKKKTKICKACEQDILANEMRNMYMKHDTYHQLRVKEYCKNHEFNYKGHKCKPIWCNKCKYLERYEIIIDTDVA